MREKIHRQPSEGILSSDSGSYHASEEGGDDANLLQRKILRKLELLEREVKTLRYENKELRRSNTGGDENSTTANGTKNKANGKSTAATIRTSSNSRWKGLEELYQNEFGDSEDEPIIMLHPEDVSKRDYTDEELSKLPLRGFSSKFYITQAQIEWHTVWLRTRHTDHADHSSTYKYIRDYIKADYVTKNPTAAKYCLTELLNMCFGMTESDYYSFACTLASASSNNAENTTFEGEKFLGKSIHHGNKDELYENSEVQQTTARKQLVQKMDILFSKISISKQLIHNNADNIYRLAFCMARYKKNKLPLSYSLFTFGLQTCITTYVILSATNLDGSDSFKDIEGYKFDQNIALAIFVFMFSVLVAMPEIKSVLRAYKGLYRKQPYPSFVMDFIVNVIIPVLVACFGVIVILQGDYFIDGVLNAVALLFIAEIDDQLPKILELDTIDIVQSFLIDHAMAEYEKQGDKGQYNSVVRSIEFSDMHITNTKERGSVPCEGVTFAPYEVTTTKVPMQNNRHQLANKRVITANCLLRTVEWQYTGGFPKTTTPRVGYLRLVRLDGEEIIIKGRNKAKDNDNMPTYTINGIYIVTSYQMSEDILRLRVCGSQDKKDFFEAFEYYSLWPLDSSARRLLRKTNTTLTEEQKQKNSIVLLGFSSD